MLLKNRPKVFLCLANVSLLLFSAMQYWSRHSRHAGLSEGVVDGLTGAFLGMAIGCMVLFMRTRARERC